VKGHLERRCGLRWPEERGERAGLKQLSCHNYDLGLDGSFCDAIAATAVHSRKRCSGSQVVPSADIGPRNNTPTFECLIVNLRYSTFQWHHDVRPICGSLLLLRSEYRSQMDPWMHWRAHHVGDESTGKLPCKLTAVHVDASVEAMCRCLTRPCKVVRKYVATHSHTSLGLALLHITVAFTHVYLQACRCEPVRNRSTDIASTASQFSGPWLARRTGTYRCIPFATGHGMHGTILSQKARPGQGSFIGDQALANETVYRPRSGDTDTERPS